jgi:hypothetical protein
MLVRGMKAWRFSLLIGAVIGMVYGDSEVGLAQQGRIGDVPPSGAAAPKDIPDDPALTQQASYLLGQQIFNDFARDQVDINLEALIQGMQDAAERNLRRFRLTASKQS